MCFALCTNKIIHVLSQYYLLPTTLYKYDVFAIVICRNLVGGTLNAIHHKQQIHSTPKKRIIKKQVKKRKNELEFYAEIPQAKREDPTKQVLLFIFFNNGGI